MRLASINKKSPSTCALGLWDAVWTSAEPRHSGTRTCPGTSVDRPVVTKKVPALAHAVWTSAEPRHSGIRTRPGSLGLWDAVWTGFEPATSGVTGRHSNQLNYQTTFSPFFTPIKRVLHTVDQ